MGSASLAPVSLTSNVIAKSCGSFPMGEIAYSTTSAGGLGGAETMRSGSESRGMVSDNTD